MIMTVERAGFLNAVQDLGRLGAREHGVSVGGALDPFALRIANALVGNDDAAAGIEITFGAVELRFDDERVIAWIGEDFDVRIGKRKVPASHATLVAARDKLTISAPQSPSRAWLAISGGIDVPFVLGSRSTDLRSGFGGLNGRALRDRDRLQLGTSSRTSRRIVRTLRDRRIGDWTAQSSWVHNRSAHVFLRVTRGSDWSRFTAEAQTTFRRWTYSVLRDSDRMGARLAGPSLKRARSEEMLSEPVAPGTIQVPPDGKPILLLNDCQTIGGYPKIAHVITVDLGAAARLRPDDVVQFREVKLEEAHALLLEREQDFERFRLGLNLRFS
ncbi:MAG: biotin-dependent carboxyltransferase family protein [Chthoniobacterales bacterium]